MLDIGKGKKLVTLLRDGDNIVTSQADKANLVDQFYSNLIGQSVFRESTIDLEALGLPAHNLSTLDAPFTKQEVWEAVSNLPSDKAPGPDGFTERFNKVLNAISAVWSRNFINLDKVNSAYIAMVPKIDGTDQVKDFRPISLVHSFAKLVTKILANRLASKLNELVSPNQSAFIKGRFIKDNFMQVQQTSRFLHQQNRACLLFKLDITKAFDSVSWPSLIEVLQALGFGQVWRDIICGFLVPLLLKCCSMAVLEIKSTIEGGLGKDVIFFLEHAGELRIIILSREGLKKTKNNSYTKKRIKGGKIRK
jgi:hypothetical protein